MTFVLFLPNIHFGQTAPNLGTVANFVLFSSDGAVTMNTSNFSQITGDVGTGNPATTSTGFGNINGNHHDGDAVGIAAAGDLLLAYNQIYGMIPNDTISPLLGNGDTLLEGVHYVPSAASLDLFLYLDAKGDSAAVFIFQMSAPFSTSANAKVKLINGAQACNVFWAVEGLVDMATGTMMKGTVIANNDAIVMAVGDTLEGRAFSTTGAITINGLFAYTPLGCGTPVLTGPTAPTLGAAACFAVFSSNGAVSNTGVTKVTGDVGSNGTTAPTGFVAGDVIGTIHPSANSFTAQCSTDLALAYTYLDLLPVDILLKFPAQFGNNLVLTPHTYHMNAAPTFTDTVVLNAQGNINAVFVIKINGALSTTVNSKVKLINGAQAKNVYWKIDGAVLLNDNSTFGGTVIVNNSSVDALNTGVKFDGRVLTTTGALSSTAINVVAPMIPTNGSCDGTVGVSSLDAANAIVAIYPNPSNGQFTVSGSESAVQLQIFDAMGQLILETTIAENGGTINLNKENGFYLYRVIGNDNAIQSGTLVTQ